MCDSIQKLFVTKDNFELCSGIHEAILQYHGEGIDPSTIEEPERVVLLVFHVSGIIDNGGFQYLFEGDLPGDPYFALTAEAFRAIGCREASEAFDRTLAMFPKSRPQRDIRKRLKHFLEQQKVFPSDMDMQFFKANEEITSCLAEYIRTHAAAYSQLGRQKQTRTSKSRGKQSKKPAAKTVSKKPNVDDLPRWARVAFAARCARHAYPLLAKNWPTIPSKRSNAVLRAIELAEQSAAAGKAAAGVERAFGKATQTAGAALSSRPEDRKGESRPKNAFLGTIASLLANSAARAAESVFRSPEYACMSASDAMYFAIEAAQSAEELAVIKAINSDLEKLFSTAKEQNWTDKTKVKVEFWDEGTKSKR